MDSDTVGLVTRARFLLADRTLVHSCLVPFRDRLMVAEIDGNVLMVPLAPARDGNPTRCRPIGCYQASKQLADQYRRDR